MITIPELNYVINCNYESKGQKIWEEGPVIKLSVLKKCCPKKYINHLKVLEFFKDHPELNESCRACSSHRFEAPNQILVACKKGFYVRFTFDGDDTSIQYFAHGGKMANFCGISNDKLVSIINDMM